uniref:Uncharacterized protein n=1 Tax=viral metagenome TaxID=1070528 RepID=A0A6M3J7J4_9ZZZZ
MGEGDETTYRPHYRTRDADTGEDLLVVWYAHRDAPSLIPWITPSTADLPNQSSLIDASLWLFRNRSRP